jgi:hypothetical protein
MGHAQSIGYFIFWFFFGFISPPSSFVVVEDPISTNGVLQGGVSSNILWFSLYFFNVIISLTASLLMKHAHSIDFYFYFFVFLVFPQFHENYSYWACVQTTPSAPTGFHEVW